MKPLNDGKPLTPRFDSDAIEPPIDPYLPNNGNRGFHVSRYELDLQYRVSANRLEGKAVVSAVTVALLQKFSLDFGPALTATKVAVNGSRGVKFSHRGTKLIVTLSKPLAPGVPFIVTISYGGTPKPIEGRWGSVGWEELTEGSIVASQPNGAASWFPCDDHPSSKASYLISITTDSPYYALANGTLVRKQTKSSRTTWVYEQPEPMATYLATIQIGPYDKHTIDSNTVPMSAVLPSRLVPTYRHDFGRQGQMMDTFVSLFGPYPFADYTVVITDDDLEIPVEAQGMSIFGANHCDGNRGYERLVAHELAHQWFGNSLTLARWQDIWLHEGFACYSEWIWSENSGGSSAHTHASRAHSRLSSLPQDIVLADPGPEKMFDDRVYKRGALAVHALRRTIGDDSFFDLLREWTGKFRYGAVTTEDFTDLAARYGTSMAFWDPWLNRRKLPTLP